jgi:hypothetical protein
MKSRFGSALEKARRVLGGCIIVLGAFVLSSHFTNSSDPDASDYAAIGDIPGVVVTIVLGLAIMAIGGLVHGRTGE